MRAQTEADAPEFDRLLKFMTREGPRFGLAMALYVDARQAAGARAELERIGADKGRKTASLELDFGDGERDLVAAIVEAGEGADVLFVLGLELLVVDGAGRQRYAPAVANLNQRRDELPSLLGLRVVFWLPQSAYRELAEVAWDLCQVMLSTAEFTGKLAAEEQVSAEADALELDGDEHEEIDEDEDEDLPEWMTPAASGEREALSGQLDSLEQLLEEERGEAERGGASTDDEDQGLEDVALSAGELAVRLGELKRGRELLRDAARRGRQRASLETSVEALHKAAQVSLALGELSVAEQEVQAATEELAQASRERAQLEQAPLERAPLEAAADPDELPLDMDAAFASLDDDEEAMPSGGSLAAPEPPSFAPAPVPAPSPAAPPRPAASPARPAPTAKSAVFSARPGAAASRPPPSGPAPAARRLEAAQSMPPALGPEPPQGRPSLAEAPSQARPSMSAASARRAQALQPKLSTTTAQIRARQGAREASFAALEDALAGHEARGDERGRAEVFGHMAGLYEDAKQFARALEVRRTQELPAHLAAGDERRAIQTRTKIAKLMLRLGEAEPAVEMLQQQVLPAVEALEQEGELGADAAEVLAASFETLGRPRAAAQARHEYGLVGGDESSGDESLGDESSGNEPADEDSAPAQTDPAREPAVHEPAEPDDARGALLLLALAILAVLLVIAGI